jgi:hypothetical protein
MSMLNSPMTMLNSPMTMLNSPMSIRSSRDVPVRRWPRSEA